MEYFVKGCIIGLSVAAPVGPIGVLCINRTLNKGFWKGFLSGLGASTADLFYGIIAVIGLSVVSSTLIKFQIPVRIVGVFIGSLSWWLFLSGVISLIQRRINERMRNVINLISGFILIGFAVYLLILVIR